MNGDIDIGILVLLFALNYTLIIFKGLQEIAQRICPCF